MPPQKNLTRELNGFLEKQLDDRITSWKDKLEDTKLKQIRTAWLSRQPNSNGRLIGCGPSYNQGFMTNIESGYRSSAEAKGVIKYRLQTEIAIECMRSRARKMTQALATRLNPYGSVQRASKYASLKWEKERERRVLENDRTKSNGGLTFSFSHHHRSV